MKFIQNVLPAFFASAALVAAVAWHPSAQAQAKPAAGPIVTLTDPCPIKAENWRGMAFYEILFMFRQPNGGGIGNYFNSLSNALPAPNDEMDARFRALNAETLKKEFGGDGYDWARRGRSPRAPRGRGGKLPQGGRDGRPRESRVDSSHVSADR